MRSFGIECSVNESYHIFIYPVSRGRSKRLNTFMVTNGAVAPHKTPNNLQRNTHPKSHPSPYSFFVASALLLSWPGGTQRTIMCIFPVALPLTSTISSHWFSFHFLPACKIHQLEYKFLVFDTEFLVFNTKFIVFTGALSKCSSAAPIKSSALTSTVFFTT